MKKISPELYRFLGFLICFLIFGKLLQQYIKVFYILPDISNGQLNFSSIVSSFWLNNSGLNPCQKLLFLLNGTYPDSCPYNCLSPIQFGRFSNQLIEFLRAVQICKLANINRILLPPKFLEISGHPLTNFYYDDIHVMVWQTPEPYSSCFIYNSLYRTKRIPRIKLDEPINDTLREIFYNILPKVDIPNNSLVIHIRSGDVFNISHSSYSQPPCKFYIEAIKMKNWSNVYLIAENDYNPCVNIVKPYTTSYKKQSWEIDLAHLLYAENLVVSHGTIWIAVSFLSKNLKTLYMCDHPERQIKDHMNCIPSNSFRKYMVGWSHSKRQSIRF